MDRGTLPSLVFRCTFKVTVMPFLINHFLEHSAEHFPDKEAVVHGENIFSYLQIEEYSNRIGNWLLAADIQKGDRIALLHRNSFEYIGLYYGILKSGAVVVPLNTGLDAHETQSMIADCQARAVITESHFSRLVDEMCKGGSRNFDILAMSDGVEADLSGHSLGCIWIPDVIDEYSEQKPSVQCIDQDLSTIVYTSGSTGKPKGVMLSHLNVVANTKSIVSYLRLSSDERVMVILPFFYVYGKSLLNSHFFLSATVIIDNRFTFPNVVLQEMIEKKATSFAGVPSTYSTLVNRTSAADMRFPDLRYLTQAGGHMHSTVRERLVDIFPKKKIYIMYGATEASARLAFLDPDEFLRKKESFGKAIPNVEIKVVNEEGIETEPGQNGEIVARGSNIMMGYWNAPVETANVLKEGWYYTGDLGARDSDGDFYVTGRKRDMIKVGIYKVSAKEIEDVLYTYSGIHEAVVVGIPDDNFGEVIKAAVVFESGKEFELAEIFEFCSRKLPEYKVPSEILVLRELPKTDSGKILRSEMVEIFLK